MRIRPRESAGCAVFAGAGIVVLVMRVLGRRDERKRTPSPVRDTRSLK